MVQREEHASGGIMADHLGMGKTVQMLGLIASSYQKNLIIAKAAAGEGEGSKRFQKKNTDAKDKKGSSKRKDKNKKKKNQEGEKEVDTVTSNAANNNTPPSISEEDAFHPLFYPQMLHKGILQHQGQDPRRIFYLLIPPYILRLLERSSPAIHKLGPGFHDEAPPEVKRVIHFADDPDKLGVLECVRRRSRGCPGEIISALVIGFVLDFVNQV